MSEKSHFVSGKEISVYRTGKLKKQDHIVLYHRKNEQNTAEVIDRKAEGYTRMETELVVLR